MTYVDFRPDNCRQVLIEIDGRSFVGELEAYRHDTDGVWRGWIRWSEGVGKTRIAWLHEGQIGLFGPGP